MEQEGALTSGYTAMQTEPPMTSSLESSQAPLVRGDVQESLLKSDGWTVSDVSRRRSKGKKRTAKGGTLRKADTAWYIFDNLSCDQAEDLLRRHGENGTYLVAHFHDPESYGLSIRLSEGEDVIYKHYAIGISGNEFHPEGFAGGFPTIEEVVGAIQERLKPIRLIPIFHQYNCETCDYSISLSAEEPPDYTQAEKYPQAARRRLPLIMPIRPTLRRMMGMNRSYEEGDPEDEAAPAAQEVEHGCCWKLFHTDPGGKWYKPHKAGPVTGFILVIGWIIFLLLFGWIIALALILVFILVVFAYILNFLCTGRCEISEEEE